VPQQIRSGADVDTFMKSRNLFVENRAFFSNNGKLPEINAKTLHG
jgi:hypothetical protein